MPINRILKTLAPLENLLERDQLRAREDLVFELSHEEFRVKELLRAVITGLIDRVEVLLVHFAKMPQVDYKSDVKLAI